MTYEELLDAYQPLGILDEQKVSLLKRYAELLLEANAKFNLTAIKEIPEIVEKHFYDCLLPLKEFDLKGKKILDVGSGGGFPGLVFAIALPESQLTLLDATAKKCVFLKETAEALGLKNVHVVNSRAEDFDMRNCFDVVTGRAVAAMPKLLEITAPFAKVNGSVLLMKALKGNEELSESQNAIKVLNLKLEKTQQEKMPNGEERLNFLFVKKDKTLRKYPRSWKEIMAKPL